MHTECVCVRVRVHVCVAGVGAGQCGLPCLSDIRQMARNGPAGLLARALQGGDRERCFTRRQDDEDARTQSVDKGSNQIAWSAAGCEQNILCDQRSRQRPPRSPPDPVQELLQKHREAYPFVQTEAAAAACKRNGIRQQQQQRQAPSIKGSKSKLKVTSTGAGDFAAPGKGARVH